VSVLVTGCAGFIGSHLTETLLSDGEAVVGVDCFNDNYGRAQKLANLERAQERPGFDFVPIDLARGDLEDLIEEVDAVFHLAAEPGVRPSWGSRFEQYVRNNVLATQHLLEAAKLWPEKRFVYASSSSIYGDAERLPTSEETTPAPVSPYGMTKLSGEHLCRLYQRSFGIESVILRYFTVYGPRQRPDMAFDRMCRSALKGETVTVFGDGRQTRDFTFVADAVAATRAAAERPEVVGRVFNVGGGSRISLNDVIAVLGEITGAPLKVERSTARRGDVRDTAADITAAQETLGYQPSVSIADGLRMQWSGSCLASRQLPREVLARLDNRLCPCVGDLYCYSVERPS
jgi:nucleoside-diphosphate-sugar epimerase